MIPICKNCVHFRLAPKPPRILSPTQFTYGDQDAASSPLFGYKCAYFTQKDCVTGIEVRKDCHVLRKENGECGPHAIAFQERPDKGNTPTTLKEWAEFGKRFVWDNLFYASRVWRRNVHVSVIGILICLLSFFGKR